MIENEQQGAMNNVLEHKILVSVMYRRETISTLECIPIQVRLHSYNSKAPLGFRVVSCSVYSNQIASESSRPA